MTRRYGASPLHLLAHLVALPLAEPIDAEGHQPDNFLVSALQHPGEGPRIEMEF